MNQLRACQLTIGCAALLWLNGCVPDVPSITEEDKKPFILAGGSNAALLVHGFPGSPAQMRPLAEALQARGWTVQCIYIPGGSGGFTELSKLSGTEWTQTVSKAAAELAQVHPRLLVVGYSMGAAMTCASLSPQQVSGLVLIAPYQWKGGACERLMWACLHPAGLPGWHPPAIRLSHQLREIVRHAYQPGWDQCTKPILVIQGAQDTVAVPERSRLLALHCGPNAQYLEVPGDHLVLESKAPAFPEIARRVCDFADGLTMHSSLAPEARPGRAVAVPRLP